jgi:hypothetical protein
LQGEGGHDDVHFEVFGYSLFFFVVLPSASFVECDNEICLICVVHDLYPLLLQQASTFQGIVKCEVAVGPSLEAL